MLIGHYQKVREDQPTAPGMQATIRWLVAAKEGAPNFAMRVIEIKRNGERIQLHRHPYEHEIFVIEGSGAVLGTKGPEPLSYGNFLYIQPEEEHGFENTGDKPFRFICVIPKTRP